MIKYTVFILSYFFSGGLVIAGNTKPDPFLIVPGKSIGLNVIDAKDVLLFKSLGSASMNDAAMGGKDLASWYSKPVLRAGDSVRYETNIYFTTPNFGMPNAAARAQIIRVTSPRFITKQLIGVGAGFDKIYQYFPKVKRLASYISPSTKQLIRIYDDLRSGISFEIDPQQNCVGVTVHKPGEAPLMIYGGLFSDLSQEQTFNTPAVHIGLNDNGKTFKLDVGEKFDITLHECVGCQFVWEDTAIDSTRINTFEDTYSNRSCRNCVGGSRDRTFHFQVKAKGRSQLSFRYFEKQLTVTIDGR